MSGIIEAKYREVMPERLGVIAAEIRSLQMSMCMQAIEIGRRLEEAKTICPRGKWGEWVKDMTGYSQSMAENYIKVFNGYGGGQINIGGDFMNSQSFANLGVTKLLELLAVPPEDREEFVRENDVENKSVSELRELLELEKKKNEDAVKKRIELESRVSEIEAAKQRMKVEAEMYLEQIERLEEQLKDGADAELPESELDKFRIEAENAVREDTEKRIKALQEKVKKSDAKIEKLEADKKKLKDKLKSEADNVRNEEAAKVKASEEKAKAAAEQLERALEEVDRLNKKISMSDPAITEFKTLFESAQDSLDKLNAALGRVIDKSVADKLRCAVNELVKRYSV